MGIKSRAEKKIQIVIDKLIELMDLTDQGIRYNEPLPVYPRPRNHWSGNYQGVINKTQYMSKTEQFIKVITDAVNYDNVAFPTMRLSNDLRTIWILYPTKNYKGERADISFQLIKLLADSYPTTSNKPELAFTSEIFLNDGILTIEVKLKE